VTCGRQPITSGSIQCFGSKRFIFPFLFFFQRQKEKENFVYPCVDGHCHTVKEGGEEGLAHLLCSTYLAAHTGAIAQRTGSTIP
jgi:hypothetical protein